jgi:hypothetical protein
MRRLIFGLLILTTITNCTRTGTTETAFDQIVLEDTVSEDNLKTIDRGLLKKWGNDGPYAEYLSFYYYLDLKGKFSPKVIKKTGDDYSALILMTFDKDGNPIDEYEIAGGDCGGPSELEDKIAFCPYKKSIMISDSEFIVREIHEFTTDTINWVTTESDSIEWRIYIDDKGKIKKKD